MRVAGHRTLAAPRDEVFEAIHDPTMLLACIPGCEAVERVSPTGYRAQFALRLPSIAGSYELSVRVVDAIPPASCRLDGRVVGRPGAVTGQATLELTDVDGGSLLDYTVDARIDGPLAWLDSTLVERLARGILEQGLARLDHDLARRAMAGDAEARP